MFEILLLLVKLFINLFILNNKVTPLSHSSSKLFGNQYRLASINVKPPPFHTYWSQTGLEPATQQRSKSRLRFASSVAPHLCGLVPCQTWAMLHLDSTSRRKDNASCSKKKAQPSIKWPAMRSPPLDEFINIFH